MSEGNELSVRLISKPSIDWTALRSWVDDQDGYEWTKRVVSQDMEDAEVLVEAAGRRCYKSWAPGINPNVTKVREDSEEYIRNIVKVNHGSVLEHAQFTFAIENVDRVVTHELIRHRVGTAISQESQRYVRLQEIPFRHPEWILENPDLREMAEALLYQMVEFQILAAEAAGIDDPERDFHYKKEVTSDLRRYAPQGVLTGLVWSANLRTLRQTIEARTAFSAEREIRLLFHLIGLIMLQEAPAVFADFEAVYQHDSDIPAWVPGRKS